MASLDLLMKALDTAHWEMGEAFKGLNDEDVWRRPDPKLLSVGEIASHVAYWEMTSFLGEGGAQSPLFVEPTQYYTANAPEQVELQLGADEVYAETQRIHTLCKESFAANPHDSEEQSPHREGWTWQQSVEYQVFHVAYHTGQMYSVRHLFGHETVDN